MNRESYSYILVTQGNYQFYIVALPSTIFKETCFTVSRAEDPDQGFQRKLDEGRANAIADYIDNGLGSIPTAIILSAQPEALLKRNIKNKTISFEKNAKSFLIIDGQHRVWGYQKAKKEVRVPVIIYEDLSRIDEARLFIDINENQKKVSDELILDVKRLLEIETEDEKIFSTMFNLFLKKPDSTLKNYINVGEKNRGNLSRLVFNNAISDLVKGRLRSLDDIKKYEVINNYLTAFNRLLSDILPNNDNVLSKTIVFQAVMNISDFVISLTYDKHKKLDEKSFYETIKPIKSNLSPVKVKNPGKSYRALSEHLKEAMIKKSIPPTICTQ
jgi:DGQHR domain-containing protein